jgi:hypothetical protein
MREKYLLHDRVELVGTLMQHEVRNVRVSLKKKFLSACVFSEVYIKII